MYRYRGDFVGGFFGGFGGANFLSLPIFLFFADAAFFPGWLIKINYLHKFISTCPGMILI